MKLLSRLCSKLRSLLQSLWKRIPKSWKEEMASFSHTFFASLFLTVAMQLQSGTIPMTKDALASLALAAVRSAWKVTFNKIVLKK